MKVTGVNDNKKIQELKAGGLILKRSLLNYQRLQTEHYTPENVFRKASYNWYGDWEGRAVLALSHATMTTGESMEHLKEIIRKLPMHFNEKGYMGPIYTDGVKDEQQLAGHSWLLRGLLAYVKLTGDEKVKAQIQTIIENLVMQTKGCYKQYPAGSTERARLGEAMGTTTHEIANGWKLSTDVGCAFILLDGVTDVYDFFGGTTLRELIEEMIAHFFKTDVVQESFQTHATLTALRGVLRFMKTENTTRYLTQTVERMQAYVENAMTENYQNYNWFGVPKATEPCAVTDSFIVALELWEMTKDAKWLQLAENIYYNGYLASQRDNGGFGCDVCTGSASDRVFFTPSNYEAFWCCSMRGAEGFYRYLEKSVKTEENDIIFPVYNSFEAKLNNSSVAEIKHETEYPYAGKGSIVIQTKTDFRGTVRLYVPQNTKNFSVYADGVKTEVCIENGFAVVPIHAEGRVGIEYAFDLTETRQKALRVDGFTHRKGVLILGENAEKGIVPISDALISKQEYERNVQYKILYN